jgi:hypothetical protein
VMFCHLSWLCQNEVAKSTLRFFHQDAVIELSAAKVKATQIRACE